MKNPEFTDADLARLALSRRLRELSDAFRLGVAARDGETGGQPGRTLATQLWTLAGTELPLLQDAIIDYTRSTGSSWTEIAELTGLDEDELSSRWTSAVRRRPADPAAVAAALDEWYVRHAQLEPLARVSDPFSRLLTGREPRDQSCLICAKYAGEAVPAWAGFADPPGGHLVDDGIWRVGHGPTPYWPAGTLLIESQRHFLDYADFTPEEAATLGPLIRQFTAPLKEATGAQRIHVFSSMEGTEHFHLWMVPRTGDVQSGRTYLADPGYCTAPAAEAVIDRVRKIMPPAGAYR